MHNLPLFALGLCGSFGFPSRAVVARRTLSAVHLSCRLQCPALKSNGSTHSGNMRATQRAVLCNQPPGIQASRPILRLALVQGNGMVATDKQVCCIFATLRLLGRRTPHAGRATLGALSELNYAEKGGSVTDPSATPGSYAVASVTPLRILIATPSAIHSKRRGTKCHPNADFEYHQPYEAATERRRSPFEAAFDGHSRRRKQCTVPASWEHLGVYPGLPFSR